MTKSNEQIIEEVFKLWDNNWNQNKEEATKMLNEALSLKEQEVNELNKVNADFEKANLELKEEIDSYKQLLSSLQEKIEELKKELCYDKDESCNINLCKTQGGEVYVCPSCRKFKKISKIFKEKR